MAKIVGGRVLKEVKTEPEKQPEAQETRSGGRFGRAEPHDYMRDFSTRPPEFDFVIPGFLAGTVGALVAPGATGKSYLALEIAMAVASGGLADPLGIRPNTGGKVLYLAGEDPDIVLTRRNYAIGQHLGPEARQAVADNLQLRCTMGIKFDVMTDAQDLIDLVMPPDENGEPQNLGYRLIILDTLSRIHKMDENNNGDMAKLLSQLEYIARQTSASVLVLHHTGKNAAREGQLDQQHAARGASALIDNARWCGYVAKMSPTEAADRGISEALRPFYIRYGVSKQNYDTPVADAWLKRVGGGVLLPADDLPEAKMKQAKAKKASKASDEDGYIPGFDSEKGGDDDF